MSYIDISMIRVRAHYELAFIMLEVEEMVLVKPLITVQDCVLIFVSVKLTEHQQNTQLAPSSDPQQIQERIIIW